MKISILGLGAYAIALAKVFEENDNKVCMWSKYKDEVDIVKLKRENPNLLPGVKLSKSTFVTNDMEECVKNAKIIVLAVPMNAVREVSRELSKFLDNDQVICLVSKAIEQNTNKLLSDVVYEETKSDNICMLSGPSFAMELASNEKVGLIAASSSNVARMALKVCLENEHVIVDASKDIIGVQLCAICKNIYGIMLGIMYGMKFSKSTIASNFAKVTNDLRIILEVLGGKEYTIFTYAGIGDLLLTCMNEESRNFKFGYELGSGKTLNEVLELNKGKTVEGIYSVEAIYNLLNLREVNIKSIDIMYDILVRGMDAKNVEKYM